MTENKADPLREALKFYAGYCRDEGRRAREALAAPQPAAPLGGREAIDTALRAYFQSRFAPVQMSSDGVERVYCNGFPLNGLIDTILAAAIPQERGVDSEDDPGTYDEGITYAIMQLAELTGSKDSQIRDGSEDHATDVQDTIIDVLKCAGLYDDETGKFAALAAPIPTANIAALPDLKTDPELLALIERSKNYVMTPAEMYEQQRSFLRGQCPLRRDYKEWCAEVDRLLPPAALAGKETDQ